MNLPGYTWPCGLQNTDVKLQTLQDEDMILILEKNIGSGICSILGNRYVKPDKNRKTLYIDAKHLHGSAMSVSLPYDENKFDKNVN